MNRNENGFAALEIIMIIIFIGLVATIGWLFFDRQQSAKDSEPAAVNGEQAPQAKIDQVPEDTKPPVKKKVAKTVIYPSVATEMGNTTISKDISFTAKLPAGWSVQKVFDEYDLVKTISNDKYLMASSIEHGIGPNSNRKLMEQRADEGSKLITSVTTSSGASISILKTSTTLFLSSCKYPSEKCYLPLNGKKLDIAIYRHVPGAQSAVDTTYPQEIINDFESFAKSLSI